MSIEIKVDNLSQVILEQYLKIVDPYFTPPLSQKLNIKEFSLKIINNGVIISARKNNEIIGILAFYCNDHENSYAYITNLSVLPKYYGKDIAVQLMNVCLNYIKNKSFKTVGLEVNKRNQRAIFFYEKIGFKVKEIKGESIFYLKII